MVIFGERKYAMRIWLDPVKLAARGLTALDVVSALQEQNVEIPAGQLGQPPSDPSQNFQLPIRAVGRLSIRRRVRPHRRQKHASNGLVLLRDVGRAELGAESYSTDLKYSNQESVGIGVQQLSNANALEVDKLAKAKLEELSTSFPPGLKYEIPFDVTTVVGDSIREVVYTLLEAIVIVIVVIFFFLLDWRATIIPAITIPVSLIGTFAFLKVFGFSINSLTMFGITLATGLVVDDAIVVIENVQRHISDDHSEPHIATSIAMSEVTSAVIATSLVLVSVFIPVAFFPGTTGILYRQFSLTIAFSIAISAFNALTLSPALAALFLRGEKEKWGIFGYVDRSIQAVSRWYGIAIHHVLQLRYLMLVLFVLALGATGYMYTAVPTAFIPSEDQNYLICVVQAPPGASLTYTSSVAEKAVEPDAGRRRRLRHLLDHGIQPDRRFRFQLRRHLRAAEVASTYARRRATGTPRPSIQAYLSPQALRRPRRTRGPVRATRHPGHQAPSAASSLSYRTWAAIRCRTSTSSLTRSSVPAAPARS